MALTASTMLALGTSAPPLELPDVDGKNYSLDDFSGSTLLLVMFICNHCPYVKHIRGALALLTREFHKNDLAVVAINSNDATQYPDDSPEKMREEKKRFAYTFPYLIDASQEVAKAYKAACTPDFFLFDLHRELIYRGQFDDSRPGNREPITGDHLRRAIQLGLKGALIPEKEQVHSMGCNIKWKPGNEPTYFKSTR